MSDCTHDCSSCGESCGERTAPQDFRAPANGLSHIGKVIAVVSGKGGVGKSLVTSSLAVAMRRMGKKVGVLDADITGSSIPAAFGVHTKAEGSELGIYPAETKTGIEIMSLNLLTENETDPVVWRGPVIAGAVKKWDRRHLGRRPLPRMAPPNRGRRAPDGVPSPRRWTASWWSPPPRTW